MKNKNFISSYALFATIIVTTVGVNVFSYPRELTEQVNGDGWIVILITTLIIFLLMKLIYKIIEQNDFMNLYDLLEKTTGKFLGTIITISFIVQGMIYVSVGLRVFTEEIKIYVLEDTPTEFIFIITILTGVYLVRGELDNVIKFNEIVFWIMFVPVFFVMLFTINNVDFTNILPVLNNKPINYIKDIPKSINRYSGFLILFLVVPFVQKKKKVNKIILKSLIFISAFYIIIFILVIGAFGKEQTKALLWPVITLVKTIHIPGAFVERWEGIIMTIWLIFYFSTFTNVFYFIGDLSKRIFNFKDIKLSVAIISPIIYLMALYPENIVDVYNVTNTYLPVLTLVNFIGVPFLIFVLSKIKKGGEKDGKKN